jgi:2-oxo-hept-3-ene-1,7-dioate hydratase
VAAHTERRAIVVTAGGDVQSLDDDEIGRIADELASAERTRSVVGLLTTRYPGMTVGDSYAVQNVWRNRGIAAGRRLVGRKIGLTSKVMQVATGISEPDYGSIFSDTVFDNGAVIEHDRFSNVRVEVELAFVLGASLTGPDVTVFDVLRATDYVVPALEILSSRIELAGRTIVDTISDNAAFGGLVYGGNPVRPSAVDLRWVSALLYRNETVEETGVAAAVLNHPASGVAWLANKLARHGDQLKAGEIVLAGSFTRPVWIQKGDVVLADYRDLGTVTCRFV